MSLPVPPNLGRFTHEIRVPDYFCRNFRRRITSHEQRKTIDQASPTPVHQLLTNAMQAILFAQRTKYLGGHAGVSMMRPVEDLRLDQRFREDLRKPFARRIG